MASQAGASRKSDVDPQVCVASQAGVDPKFSMDTKAGVVSKACVGLSKSFAS